MSKPEIAKAIVNELEATSNPLRDAVREWFARGEGPKGLAVAVLGVTVAIIRNGNPETDAHINEIRPGDIVQITDPQHAWYESAVIVEQTHGWGVALRSAGGEYERARYGAFAFVGTAPMIPADIAASRRASLGGE